MSKDKPKDTTTTAIDENKFLDEVKGVRAEADEPESARDEVADIIAERSLQSAGDTPPAPVISRQMVEATDLMRKNKENVEAITTFQLGLIEVAEAKLAELKGALLDDSARIKSELDAQLVSAEAVSREMASIDTLISDIQSRRRSILPGG
jgi:hypothetical protein